MRRRSLARPPPPMLRRALYLLRWRLYAVCVRLCALVGGRVGTCVVVGGCLVCTSGRSVGGCLGCLGSLVFNFTPRLGYP